MLRGSSITAFARSSTPPIGSRTISSCGNDTSSTRRASRAPRTGEVVEPIWKQPSAATAAASASSVARTVRYRSHWSRNWGVKTRASSGDDGPFSRTCASLRAAIL